MKKQNKQKFRPFFTGLTLFTLAIVGLTSMAFLGEAKAADAPIILVVNQAQLLAVSDAGKDVEENAKALQNAIAAELQKDFDSIKKEEEQLIAQQTLLAPDILRERAEKLQIRRQNFEVNRQVKSREYQASVAKARSKIASAIEPIYEDLIKEHKATMMIDRASLIFASPDLDITPEVLKRLNDKVKKVEWERVKVEVKKTGEE